MLPALRRRTAPTVWEEPFEDLRRDMERFFGGWPSLLAAEDLTGAYPVDIREDDDKVYVDAELPGFKKDEIDVSLENGLLRIAAERKPEETKGKQHLQERRYTRVLRRFTMPCDVDQSDVKAKFDNGVLHLEMKKTGEAKQRRIKIL